MKDKRFKIIISRLNGGEEEIYRHFGGERSWNAVIRGGQV
jgi:hypothetical protein